MINNHSYFRRIYLSALATPLCLMGGMLLGFGLGSFTFNSLPGHMHEASRIFLAAAFALSGLLIGSAVWGVTLAIILGSRRYVKASLAGAVGVAVTTVVVGILLNRVEVLIIEQGKGPHLPIQRIFTLLFVPSVAAVAGMGATALGWSFGKGTHAIKIGASCALAGGAAFLFVNLMMEAFGWVVGSPGAAERATMLTVMFSGSLAAAFIGGAVIGALLGRQEVAVMKSPGHASMTQ